MEAKAELSTYEALQEVPCLSYLSFMAAGKVNNVLLPTVWRNKTGGWEGILGSSGLWFCLTLKLILLTPLLQEE